MADDAEETPVAYGPTPGRIEPHARERDLKCELLIIEAELEARAPLLRRKFELLQELASMGIDMSRPGAFAMQHAASCIAPPS